MSDFAHAHEAAPLAPADETLAPESVDAVPAEETAEGWFNRLKGIDFSEHRTAIVVVGAAALAAGVGVYALTRRGEASKFFVAFGDRRAEKQGIISIGERVHGGAAVSLPVSEAAMTGIEAGKSAGTVAANALFAITGQQPSGEMGDFAYPLTGDHDQIRQHGETARKAASWLMQYFSRHVSEEQGN